MEMGETSSDVPEEHIEVVEPDELIEVVEPVEPEEHIEVVEPEENIEIVEPEEPIEVVEVAEVQAAEDVDEQVEGPADSSVVNLGEHDEDHDAHSSERDLPHPYKDELLAFKPCEWQLKKQVPVAPSPLEDTKVTYVDSQTLLDDMMAVVRQEKEMAISVQHQSYQRFQGICSLILISTRSEDFIVDVIALKNEVFALNEIFTDSNVLKVIHRVKLDLEMMHVAGLYVVNVFDTSTAGRILKDQKAQRSLAEMLKGYCFVQYTDIVHYKTDWSTRPVSEDILKYARVRVHYLLYVHDVLRNELVEKKQIEEQYKRSTQLCQVVWHPGKSRYSETSYMKVYNGIARGQAKGERKGSLNPQQLECFRLLFNWRHETAKRNDKSLGYTLSTQDMYDIAKILPRKKESIKGCCHSGVLPPLVEEYLQDVHNLVLKAIENVPYNAASREPEVKRQRRGMPQQSGQRGGNNCRKTDLIERSHMTGSSFKRGRGFAGHFGPRSMHGAGLRHSGPVMHAGLRPMGPGLYGELRPFGSGLQPDLRPLERGMHDELRQTDRGMHSRFRPLSGGMHSGFRPIRGRIGGPSMHSRGPYILNQIANRLGALAHNMAMSSDDDDRYSPTHSGIRSPLHHRGPLSRGRNSYGRHDRGR